MSFRRALRLAGAILLSAMVSTGLCETKLTPSVSARGTYDDSVLGKKESDFEMLLSPGLRLETGTEVTRVALDSRLDVFRYLEHKEYERENARAGVEISHALSERLSIGLDARWIRDHTVESEFDESGVVTDAVARNTYRMAPSLTFQVSERDEMSVSARAGLVDYERSLYTDYHFFGSTATWSHALGDGLWRVIGQIGGEQYRFDRPDGTIDQQVLTGLAGLAWKATERLELQAMGGVSHTSSEMNLDRGNGKDRNQMTFSGSLAATWKGELWRLSLEADRAESPSSYGELMTRNRLRALLKVDMSERLSLGGQAAWYQSTTSGLATDRETHTYVLGPNARYLLSEDCALEAGYLFSREDKRHSDTVEDRNRVYLNFSKAFSFFW